MKGLTLSTQSLVILLFFISGQTKAGSRWDSNSILKGSWLIKSIIMRKILDLREQKLLWLDLGVSAWVSRRVPSSSYLKSHSSLEKNNGIITSDRVSSMALDKTEWSSSPDTMKSRGAWSASCSAWGRGSSPCCSVGLASEESSLFQS